VTINHSVVIKDVAANIANLSDEAKEKITNDMLSMAGSEILRLLEDSTYDVYRKMFSDTEYENYVGDYDRSKEFHELNENERKLKKLEMAEAYLVLYYLIPALKELEDTVSMSRRQQFGEGEIHASPIRDLILQRQQYYNEAVLICNKISEESSIFIISSNNI